jgi:hypothetical protein
MAYHDDLDIYELLCIALGQVDGVMVYKKLNLHFEEYQTLLITLIEEQKEALQGLKSNLLFLKFAPLKFSDEIDKFLNVLFED